MIRTIFLMTLLLSLTPIVSVAQSDKYVAVKGSETPQFSRSSDAGNCFVFADYIVKTDHIDADGDNISVFKRSPSTNAKSACSVKGTPYLRVLDADNNSFYGIYEKYLFVDSGTSVDSRGLDVYDLVSRKSMVSEGYMNDAKLLKGRFLVFDAPTDKKGPIKACPQAAKWKRQGGGVGWLQSHQLDLQTLKKTTIGTLRCYYME
jgi:hypothetical protein